MRELIHVGDLSIALTRKAVANVQLSVHPPNGRVTMVAPADTRLDVARAYAISRLGWIRQKQEAFASQPRETPRAYVTRETHYLWGEPHLLKVTPTDGAPHITAGHGEIELFVRPHATFETKARVVHDWHKALLHVAIPPLLDLWVPRLDVPRPRYFLQHMKTKWGSCNHEAQTIRLNTELVKKPKDLLEYILVHELAHLHVPTHSRAFVKLLDQHYPTWREARRRINSLPVPEV